MFKYNNINYSNYSNNIDYKYNYKIYYSLLLHLLFLFSFSLILSFTSTSSVIAWGGSGGGGSCGEYCDLCDQKTVDICNGLNRGFNGFSSYYFSYLNSLGMVSSSNFYNLIENVIVNTENTDLDFYISRCNYCTPRNFTYLTMEEIRKRDFTKTPNFFKRDFEMFPKDGSYHIVPNDVVESLKSHISCKDDTSRYIMKEAYTEKKSAENVVIPYCKKWIVGISDNYVQSTLDDGSVNKLNPNTDIKVFCKEIDESKHININNPDTIDNYINLNSSIKLYDGFVCRDGFHKYEGGALKGSCKTPLRYEVKFDYNCGLLIKKVYEKDIDLSNFGQVYCSSNSNACNAIEDFSYDRFECYEQGTQEYNELCKKLPLWNSCRDSRKACIYVYDKVEKCKTEEKQKCESNKVKEMDEVSEKCNNDCKYYKKKVSSKKSLCSSERQHLTQCKNQCHQYYNCDFICSSYKKNLDTCNRELDLEKKELSKCTEKCEIELKNNINEKFDECIRYISNGDYYHRGVCEDERLQIYKVIMQGCYVDASKYNHEKIDDVVKYEVDICQKPIFLDSVKKVNIEKIYDPNLVNQN